MSAGNTWPAVLHLNAAASHLAMAIYAAKAEAYGGHVDPWNRLDVTVRHGYLMIAAETLKALEPKTIAFATGLRETHQPIIGAIFPSDGAA